ncbi:MAG: Tim44 domain-containing protein [Gammaproteobacteria bacterium]
MRNIFLTLLIALFSFSFMVTDAQAKRFGGGKSFGASRQASSFSSNTASRMSAAPAAKPASTASKWLGPLAGLAMGGLLASLFMGHGLGSGIMSWLLIAGGIFLLWRLFGSLLRPTARPLQNAVYSAAQAQPAAQSFSNKPLFSNISSTANDQHVDFDQAGFLRHAKSLFIRLQAAYDKKDLADLREFTAPEVFAEIQLQLQERGDAVNQTDVINVDAQLQDLANEAHGTVASVLFTGLVREEPDAEPVSIKEIWHFNKDQYKSSWAVAGIQQA